MLKVNKVFDWVGNVKLIIPPIPPNKQRTLGCRDFYANSRRKPDLSIKVRIPFFPSDRVKTQSF
jgi:hypothetical protein